MMSPNQNKERKDLNLYHLKYTVETHDNLHTGIFWAENSNIEVIFKYLHFIYIWLPVWHHKTQISTIRVHIPILCPETTLHTNVKHLYFRCYEFIPLLFIYRLGEVMLGVIHRRHVQAWDSSYIYRDIDIDMISDIFHFDSTQ